MHSPGSSAHATSYKKEGSRPSLSPLFPSPRHRDMLKILNLLSDLVETDFSDSKDDEQLQPDDDKVSTFVESGAGRIAVEESEGRLQSPPKNPEASSWFTIEVGKPVINFLLNTNRDSDTVSTADRTRSILLRNEVRVARKSLLVWREVHMVNLTNVRLHDIFPI